MPQLSRIARRRLTAGLACLAALPVGLLVACGNADHKVSSDTRPDARASTQGARTELPVPVDTDPALSNPANPIPPENLQTDEGLGRRAK